jgi:hypothetical protein
MRRQIVFVLSDTRSGSTLIDQVLGGHPKVQSLGELQWLAAYALQDRSIYNPSHPLVCTCKRPVSDCPFWVEVFRQLGRQPQSLQLQLWPFVESRRGIGSTDYNVRQFVKRLMHRFPRFFGKKVVQNVLGGDRLARDNVELFDSIFRVSARDVLIESSKEPFRFRAVYNLTPEIMRTLVLVRDYRAVVYSKMKRGRSLEDGALGWKARMQAIAALTSDVPASQQLRLKYEDFCKDPSAEIGRICEFLELEYSSDMLRRPTKGVHNIGGSPSRFDESRTEIVLDTAYQTYFKDSELEKLRELVGDEGARWGYV